MYRRNMHAAAPRLSLGFRVARVYFIIIHFFHSRLFTCINIKYNHISFPSSTKKNDVYGQFMVIEAFIYMNGSRVVAVYLICAPLPLVIRSLGYDAQL